MAAANPAQPPSAALCQEYFGVTCYGPGQLEQAYGATSLFGAGIDGAGETVVVVEPLGSPSIESDLNSFDQAFGLPNPPSFEVIAPVGPPPSFSGSPAELGWAEETSLDVEWAHAMAPGANIVLVETPVQETEGLAGFPQILEAENYVIDHNLGDVISQSFESTEETFPSASTLRTLSLTYLNAYLHGVTVVSASGDNGVAGYANPESTAFYPFRVVQWPASDPLVTAVGGTAISLDSSGNRLAPDVAWNDTYNATVLQHFANSSPPQPFASGGGISAVFARPGYQHADASVTGNHRGIPDISMNAGCTGAVEIYSGVAGGWFLICGTSEAAPLFAGVVALADQLAGHRLGLVNPALYRLAAEHAPGIVPIYLGNNTVSFPLTESASTLTPGWGPPPGVAGTLTGTLTGEAGTLTGDASTLAMTPATTSATVGLYATAGAGQGAAQGAGGSSLVQVTGTLTGNAGTLTANAGTSTVNSGTLTLPGYSANGGYSLVTGLGTVDATQLVPELASVAGCPGPGHGWLPASKWSPPWEWSPPWARKPACRPSGPPGRGQGGPPGRLRPPGPGEGPRPGHHEYGQPPGHRGERHRGEGNWSPGRVDHRAG
jgi:subtilase family serine protease